MTWATQSLQHQLGTNGSRFFISFKLHSLAPFPGKVRLKLVIKECLHNSCSPRGSNKQYWMTFFSLVCCGHNLRQLQSQWSPTSDSRKTQRSTAGGCFSEFNRNFTPVFISSFSLEFCLLTRLTWNRCESKRCTCLHFCYLQLHLQMLTSVRASWEKKKTPLTKFHKEYSTLL